MRYEPIFIGLTGLALTLLVFAFWAWALIDAINSPRLSGAERIVWASVIIFLPLLGAAIYSFAGRRG